MAVPATEFWHAGVLPASVLILQFVEELNGSNCRVRAVEFFKNALRLTKER